VASALRRLDALLLPVTTVAEENAPDSPAAVLKAAVGRILGSGGTEGHTAVPKGAKKVGGSVKRVVDEDTVGPTGAVEAQVWAST
jgi:hypothetical protein